MWPALPFWRLELGRRDRLVLARVAPELVPPVVALLGRAGGALTLTAGFRTYAEQAALYAQGRTAPGRIVTYAPPGTSWHEKGLAVDVAALGANGQPFWPASAAWWESVGQIGEALGLLWGGRFPHPDRPHFELRRAR